MKYFSYIYKHIDKLICLIVLSLGVISILMIGSTSISSGFFSRDVIVQMAAYGIGIIASIIYLHINYTIFQEFTIWLYLFALALLALVYIPGLGIEVNGARSWIDLRVVTFQPSEIVKLLYIIIMAGYFNKHRNELNSFWDILKAMAVGAPIILVVLKEDFGSAMVFAAIWIVMLFYAGIDLKSFIKFIALGAGLVPIAYIFMRDYQKDRLEAFLHPDNFSLPGNYQVWQSKVAIGSGGVFGKGLFSGTQKDLDFIPVQTSDFIFSVIGEELGLIGGILVITLFGFLLVRMMRALHYSVDFYGALIISGVIGMLTFQIFENIAMTMGLMPVTGITLPFLSYGGSSIISNVLSVALVMNVYIRGQKTTF